MRKGIAMADASKGARESGWLLRTITPDNGRLVASTAFDGVVIEQPSAVEVGVSASSADSGVR